MTKELAITLLLRFLRGGVAGAIGTMVVIMPLSGNWSELTSWLSALALAGVVGFISGLLQAIDKYIRG